jgi:hypothetical protein
MEGLTLKAQQTARRNLAQRIGRLLEAVDKAGRQPTPWEAHYTSLALDELDARHYADGERTMMWAEGQSIFDTPVSPKPLPADKRTATLAQLRARMTATTAE